MRGPDPFNYLPNPAKCALEYLDAQGYGNRSIAKLDAYLEHYFRVTGMELDEQTRYSCHHIAVRRFALAGDDVAGSLTLRGAPA